MQFIVTAVYANEGVKQNHSAKDQLAAQSLALDYHRNEDCVAIFIHQANGALVFSRITETEAA